MEKRRDWRIVLAVLTCSVVLMSASYTMLIPFLPLYLITELGVDKADVNMWNGAIFSITFLIGAVMAPIWGKIADKKGRKMMAVRASIGLSVTYFLGGIVTSPEQLFMVRILQGFAAGLWSSELAIVAGSVPMEKLGFSLGIMEAGLTSGGVIGPLLGGVLAHVFGMRASFMIAGCALFTISLITIFFVPEPLRNKDDGKIRVRQKDLLRQPIIRRMLLLAIFVQMVILILQPIITLYVAHLRGSMENIVLIAGVVFSLGGIAASIAAPFWGRMGQKKSFGKMMYMAMAGAGIAMLIQSLPNTLILFAMMQFVCGLFFAGINPSICAVLANNTQSSAQGSVFGMLFSAQQIGSMAGPLLGGVIGTYWGLKEVFVVAGFIMLSASIFVKTTRHKAY
ncbi:MFS transporter [Pectinatus brassicae]|uniref:DHA1 family multidrug resistance protein-like MFS transporter n=1 Tax=Pectinatus brassicae TaxID=862415 RepID=A0A840UGM0_9FIRM|nr:MFS transporter [Pectinatus brassicae]MBB5336159.1 DHA1 family multidrug resistance protein-like MFS transporter [Pectinatus brassicae]